MASWRLGIGKLRGSREGREGKCRLCLGKEDSKHIILECPETKDWRKEIMYKRCLDSNEEVEYRKC
jgi:hypothetical protein